MPINSTATLADLVTADPRRSRILDKLGLDYCCNGDRSLVDASEQAGLELTQVTQALDLPDAPPSAPAVAAENAELAHDIVDTHHAYMWEEMPRLQGLVDKVHSVHGQAHPELAQVREVYTQAVAALDPHMTTEERVVFPAISRMEKTRAPVAAGPFAEPIAQLRAEHQVVGDLFKQIRALTEGYAVPEGACGSYQAMLSGLEQMELDLHEHIHKENNILFPRVLTLEEQVTASRSH
ncbi:MAG: iron-sulfur cluster repair di-iron protein [Beutenbergiaceae bacterium]